MRNFKFWAIASVCAALSIPLGHVVASGIQALATVPAGGTGLQTLTSGGVLLGAGTSPVTFATSADNTQALCGGNPPAFGVSCESTAGAPVFASLAAATGNIANTETVVVSMSIPGGTFVAGGMLRVHANGNCTTTTAPGASTYQMRIGPTTLMGTAINFSSATPTTAATSVNFTLEGYATIRSIVTTTATIDASGFLWAPATLFAAATPSFGGEAGATFNPTVTNLVEFTFKSGAATSTCTFFQALIEQII